MVVYGLIGVDTHVKNLDETRWTFLKRGSLKASCCAGRLSRLVVSAFRVDLYDFVLESTKLQHRMGQYHLFLWFSL